MKNVLSILRKFRPLTIMILLTLVLCITSHASDRISKEYEVKAVFLLNFAKIIEWPTTAFDNSESNIVVGIFGNDDFGEALNTINGKTVGGRKLEVRKLGQGGALDGCHLLFISSSEKWRLRQILAEVAGQPVLTVSDISDFAEQGGIISLTNEETKIKITINQGSAQRAGLKISSQLLRIATILNN